MGSYFSKKQTDAIKPSSVVTVIQPDGSKIIEISNEIKYIENEFDEIYSELALDLAREKMVPCNEIKSFVIQILNKTGGNLYACKPVMREYIKCLRDARNSVQNLIDNEKQNDLNYVENNKMKSDV